MRKQETYQRQGAQACQLEHRDSNHYQHSKQNIERRERNEQCVCVYGGGGGGGGGKERQTEREREREGILPNDSEQTTASVKIPKKPGNPDTTAVYMFCS